LTRLKELRTAKHLTQRELSEMVGVTRVTIARYEIGERDPKGKTLIRIARALGVMVSELLGA
jgi:transcriptional regulator with XRE-family HTH domain